MRQQYTFTDGEDWTCGVCLRTPTNIVFVSEDLGMPPIYKKIPGGRRKPADKDILDTAVRELYEETGIRVCREQLVLKGSQPRHGHTYHLFSVEVPEDHIEGHFLRGKNSEEVHIIPRDRIPHMGGQFMPSHETMLRKHGLWPN